jgi:hypothetical protein
MKSTICFLLFLLITACTSIVSSTPKSVAIKAPTYNNIEEAQGMADAECKRYNPKTSARFNTKMTYNIFSFDCLE